MCRPWATRSSSCCQCRTSCVSTFPDVTLDNSVSCVMTEQHACQSRIFLFDLGQQGFEGPMCGLRWGLGGGASVVVMSSEACRVTSLGHCSAPRVTELPGRAGVFAASTATFWSARPCSSSLAGVHLRAAAHSSALPSDVRTALPLSQRLSGPINQRVIGAR